MLFHEGKLLGIGFENLARLSLLRFHLCSLSINEDRTPCASSVKFHDPSLPAQSHKGTFHSLLRNSLKCSGAYLCCWVLLSVT
jgi:hypothetical protein